MPKYYFPFKRGLYVFVGLIIASSLCLRSQAASGTWNVDIDGPWNVNTNWTPSTGFPNGVAQDAVIGANLTAARTIDFGQSINLRSITFTNLPGQVLISNTSGGTFTLNLEGTNFTQNANSTVDFQTTILLGARTNYWTGIGTGTVDLHQGINQVNNGSTLIVDAPNDWAFRLSTTNFQISTLDFKNGNNQQFNWNFAQILTGISNIIVEGGAIDILSARTRTLTANWTILGNYTMTQGSVSNLGNIDFGSSTRTVTLNGTVVTNYNIGVVSGTAGFTKNGTGVMILSGTNTISGPITVSAGTIAINNASALGSSTSYTSSGSGTLLYNVGNTNTGANVALSGGTIQEVDQNVSLGALSLSNNSSMILSSGGNSGSFRFISGTNTTGTATLTIYGWDYNSATDSGSDDLIFFTNTSFQSASFLNKVTFFGFGAGARILSSGELVPVTPEPGTFIVSAFILGLLSRTFLKRKSFSLF